MKNQPPKKGKGRKSVGRPAVVITDEQVKQAEQMAMALCKDTTIATALGISVDTFKRNCAHITHKKRAEGRVALQKAQYVAAVSGANPTMLVWLGKQHLEQTDRQDVTSGGDKIKAFLEVNSEGV